MPCLYCQVAVPYTARPPVKSAVPSPSCCAWNLRPCLLLLLPLLPAPCVCARLLLLALLPLALLGLLLPQALLLARPQPGVLLLLPVLPLQPVLPHP